MDKDKHSPVIEDAQDSFSRSMPGEVKSESDERVYLKDVRKSRTNPTDTVLALINNRGAYRKLDLLGALSLLAGSMFIITALEEARYDYRWSSALVIVFLILSALSWSVFVLWSWYLHSKTSTNIESVFTWRFFENRIFAGMILYVLGGPHELFIPTTTREVKFY
ncbi:MAG: hypothetical protein Q9159_006880 [Coniocarpon cinnabarinum]